MPEPLLTAGAIGAARRHGYATGGRRAALRTKSEVDA